MTAGASSPIVVSGLGSSGTRVVAQILQGLGLPMGRDLNQASDNLLFTLLLKRPRELAARALDDSMARAEVLLRAFGDLTTEPGAARRPSVAQELFGASRYQIRHGIERDTAARRAVWTARRLRAVWADRHSPADGPWGFKEPTAHLFLPALRRAFPSMKYVHVMRDPRDYALVPHNQAMLWAKGFPELALRTYDDPASAQVHWWAVTNLRAMTLASDHGIPFLAIRLEELIQRPDRAIEELATFIGRPTDESRTRTLSRLVTQPASVGRGRELNLSGGPELAAQIRVLGYDV